MALPYRVWTEEDVKNRNVVEKGDYPFKILNITKKRTRVKLDDHGQPLPNYEMWEIDFEFHDRNGVVKKIKDWIVFCDGMDWKLRHLAKSTNQLKLYEAQQLDATHLVNQLGVFTLGIKDGEYNGEPTKQNFIKDYIKKEDMVAPDNSFLDDDIPNM